MGSSSWLGVFYSYFDAFLIVYTVTLQALYTTLTISGWSSVNRYVGESPLSLPVTILVPAFNEEASVVESVESLLRSQFSQLQIVIVNDDSTDDTLARIVDAFEMVQVSRVPRSGLPSAPVRGLWISRRDDRVLLVDKLNGGKADALNAGINYASYPLVCSIDADTILDPGALARLVWEFQSDPDTVATGGIVRIINGSTMQDGALVHVQTPHTMLANVQIVEYLRAFLGGRIAWSRAGMLIIISGAFGLFRRDALVAAGGYDATCVGEDAELVLRLYRSRADLGLPCRISFFPDPICWTEAPSTMRTLARQRDRWQRGLAQMLWRHKAMVFNRRYGRIGWFALPVFWLFELFGPIIEALGYILVPLGLITGYVAVEVFLLLLALSTLYGFFLSLVVILMEERAFRRYPNWADLRRMTVAVFVENFGYRQWMAFVRVRAMFRLRRRHQVWGDQERMGFTSVDEPAERQPS